MGEHDGGYDGGNHEGVETGGETEMSVEAEVDTEATTESREATQEEIDAAFNETDAETSTETEVDTEATMESREATEEEINTAFEEAHTAEAKPNTEADRDNGLTEKEQAALEKPADERSWQETERADKSRNPDYQAQKSYATNPETGAVLRDKDGKMVECSPNEKGSVRPDLIKESEKGIEIRENKNYTNVNNLMQNIKHQSEQRKVNFGEDVQQTYVVAPKMSVEDASRLQDYVENKLGVNLEFQHK